MISGKSFFGVLLGVCAVAGMQEGAHAQEYRCPAMQGKSPLADADVFDGPPSAKVALVPDVSQGTPGSSYASWNVGYLSGPSHMVYLVCRYEGLGDAQAVTVKVDRTVQECVVRARKGQPAEAYCR